MEQPINFRSTGGRLRSRQVRRWSYQAKCLEIRNGDEDLRLFIKTA